MGYRTKMMVLLAKEESSYGADASPVVASNAIEAMDIKINYTGEMLERGLQKDTISPVGAKLGKRWIEITFTCELKGSGSAGTAPRLGDLFEACGFSENVGVGSSVLYKPDSTAIKSITLYVYDIQADTGNSRLHKVLGARGNINIICEAGQIAKAEFTFKGLYSEPTDVASPSAPTYESTTPAIVESSQFTLNSVTALVVQSINVDMANEVSPRDDVSSSGGLKGFIKGYLQFLD
jgi:hypothetical protein